MENDLPMPQMDLMTVKRLPPSLRGTIYETFLCAISEELALWRGIIGRIKTSFYDIDAMDENRLRAIAKTLGIPLPSVLIGGVELVREEVRSIPFKVTHKGTVTLYESLFLAVHRRGEVFIYTYSDGKNGIVPSLVDPWEEVDAIGAGVPLARVSLGDFSGTIVGVRQLDTGEALDGGGASGLWRLDTGITEISTNHLGFEYVIDRKIERGGKEYLMTREYLEYIGDNIEWGRRAKEVPHVGSQLSFALYGNGARCDIPSVGLNAITCSDFFNKVHTRADIKEVEFGCGVQDISHGIPFSLASRICTVQSNYIATKEDEDGELKAIAMSGVYDGQCVSDMEVLYAGAFDGAVQFYEFTLPHFPIRKGSVHLSLVENNGEKLEAKDNRCGVIISPWCKGSIDYATGKCSITTSFEHTVTDNLVEVSSAIGGRNSFTGVLSLCRATAGSILLAFSIGGQMYTVRDSDNGDGTGTFTSEHIYQSSVNYARGEFSIVFNDNVDDPVEHKMTLRYTVPVSFTPPAGSSLEASYLFTEDTVHITEAGFRGADGSLVGYVTFPPFEFTSNAYHLRLTIAVVRDTV